MSSSAWQQRTDCRMVHVLLEMADCAGSTLFFQVGGFCMIPCTATTMEVHGGRPGLLQCLVAAARLLHSRELMQLLACQGIIRGWQAHVQWPFLRSAVSKCLENIAWPELLRSADQGRCQPFKWA